MREITKLMINEYKLKKIKCDFSGYSFDKTSQLSFHHLVVAHKDCILLGAPCEGYIKENGAILRQSSSHDYIHVIEKYDYDMFMAITQELLEENQKGYIDIENLRKIKDILVCFEREHCGDRTKKGYPLIREEFIEGRILK